jgi:hypothetical protein
MEENMRKYIGLAAALVAALPLATFATTADARSGRHGGGWHGGHGHYGHGYGRGYHRGRGYWHNGSWIALGVGAAIVGAAAAADDCYWRHGRRYCY